MPKQSKGPAPVELEELRAALAANLRAHIRAKYGRTLSETGCAEKVGKITGVGKNTVLRAMGKGEGESDIRLDTLVKLAIHFDCTACDLLQDYGAPIKSKKRKGKSAVNEADQSARGPLQRRSG